MHRKETNPNESEYPPIAEYAYISDCHSMALVGTSGSIDWCVMPRVDAYSVFGRLLDWNKGGYCLICPDLESYEVSRKYLKNSLVLETIFTAGERKFKVYDCFTMHEGGREEPFNQIIRIMEGSKGDMPVRISLKPRFDYGMLKPWILRRNDGRDFAAIGGHQGLVISSDAQIGRAHV